MKNSLTAWILTLLCSASFGALAPSFKGDLLSGGRASLEGSLKPGRALLVCFWASWCTPCLEELRTVAEKTKLDPSLPLDVLTVNVDTSETATDVKPTVALYGIKFPVILDKSQEIFSKYQSEQVLPFSVLIDSKGAIRSTFTGYQENMMTKVKEVVGSTKTKG